MSLPFEVAAARLAHDRVHRSVSPAAATASAIIISILRHGDLASRSRDNVDGVDELRSARKRDRESRTCFNNQFINFE